MKLTASCSPFEVLPPKLWESLRRQIQAASESWGIRIELEETLSLRDAEHRFSEWQRRPVEEKLG